MKDYSRGSEWARWDLHLHTASSYDYKYKGSDSNQLLCNALIENDIQAVAITDHFVIDAERIENLRKLAPNITFFPGVELRTDKGANNLHVILLFSDKTDLKTLSDDFNSIMRRQKAKSSESMKTIYWTFDDILEFADFHNGLLSLHAGQKTNGVDQEISNAVPFKQAVKTDIAEHVSFFEVGKLTDIDDYYKHVFNCIEEKPMIICSDNHDPRKYSYKEKLWIKANPTFEGLLQCLYQPRERVYVGNIPPALNRANNDTKSYIDNIYIRRVENPKNSSVKWFDSKIQLNTGLVAIIGNKGSGKSALSDVIGHMCKCSTMDSASFLNDTRFRKMPKNYSLDYISTIQWNDGYSEEKGLSDKKYETSIEDAQYLPQKFIEEICNNIDDTFRDEIDKVIFSYVCKHQLWTISKQPYSDLS